MTPGTMQKAFFNDLAIGAVVVSITKNAISKEQLIRYAGASGDFNPLHTDEEVARKAGFDGVIAHGMLIMGFMTQTVTTWAPQRFFKQIHVRFKEPTRAGDTITVNMRVSEKQLEGTVGRILCSIEAIDQNQRIKASGTVEVHLPLVSS